MGPLLKMQEEDLVRRQSQWLELVCEEIQVSVEHLGGNFIHKFIYLTHLLSTYLYSRFWQGVGEKDGYGVYPHKLYSPVEQMEIN